MALGDSSYKGNPFAPHISMENLSREAFERWLDLFGETLDSVYTPEIAEQFKQRSVGIAGNFMRNLGI